MWAREQPAAFNSYQGDFVGGADGQDLNTLVKAALVRIDNQFKELYSSIANQDELVRQSFQQVAASLIYVDT